MAKPAASTPRTRTQVAALIAAHKRLGGPTAAVTLACADPEQFVRKPRLAERRVTEPVADLPWLALVELFAHRMIVPLSRKLLGTYVPGSDTCWLEGAQRLVVMMWASMLALPVAMLRELPQRHLTTGKLLA